MAFSLKREEASQPVLLEVLLVILFGPVELSDGPYLRDYWIPEPGLCLLLRGACGDLLLGGVEEDHGTVLSTDIRPLAIGCRRIVILPEHLHKLLIGDLGRIVLDLDHLGMPGHARAHVLV